MDPNSDNSTNNTKPDSPLATPVMPTQPNQTMQPKGTPFSSPTPQTPPSIPNIQSAEPSMNPEPIDVNVASQPPMEPEHKSNKLLFAIIIVLVVILVTLAGIFIYKQYFSSNLVETGIPLNVNQNTNEPTPTLSISPTVTPVNEEEGDLQKIQITPAEGDLKSIEQDINQL